MRPNLTLNYGVRFAGMGPLHEENNLVSSFVPSAFNPQQAVVFYRPGCVAAGPCSGPSRVAVNPLTGATLPGGFIGAEVPGIGNINNGMLQQGTNGEPRGLTMSRGPQIGPRFGLAWTPGGAAGKTVIRAGGGVFFECIQGNYMYYQITNPPVLRESQLWYGNIDTIASRQCHQFPRLCGRRGRRRASADGLQLQLWRAAGAAHEHGAGRGLCRFALPPRNGIGSLQRRALRQRLAAAEPGPY